jgi:mersacidin/lichenicidin family type 2 lantibiotic
MRIPLTEDTPQNEGALRKPNTHPVVQRSLIMKINDIIRAWKNPELRTEDMPESPAGLIDLDDVALEAVAGAQKDVAISFTNNTEGCTVSGWRVSCGYICTYTTECGC